MDGIPLMLRAVARMPALEADRLTPFSSATEYIAPNSS
jgi:hypothetical protein